MRTIKFRGKRVDNGEWVYGNYNYTFDRDYHSQSYDDVPERCHYIDTETNYYEVLGHTVGQYTGEKDYEGREIWESYIYSDCMGYLYQVIFEKGIFCLLVIPDICNHREIVPFSNICDSELKYEGNIYENPELLEVKI